MENTKGLRQRRSEKKTTPLNDYKLIMSEDIKVDKVMDLKGLPCPMPVVKVSKGIKEVEIGQVVEAHSTDPGSLTDFPAWARTSGNEILKTEQEGEIIKFYIKRSA
jgi:TusA-related sulfurtransferase